ncbi:hypothetical protein [Chthonobacter albigriseus]|uniref:hypothetical protein n=1 Tax=Chthonobacter albigriseus TaxID=1683161 RepID=UPI0015EFDBED|nr:hypothetical protein [Chthonobacter albigriseus]
MARKPTARKDFVLFDVIYQDGTQRSNRRVPGDLLAGLDGDTPARAFLEDQDKGIADQSGLPPLRIQSVRRSRTT